MEPAETSIQFKVKDTFLEILFFEFWKDPKGMGIFDKKIDLPILT